MTTPHLRDVLNCWAATRGSSVVNAAPRGFSGADVRSVETATGKFALRCWPSGAAGLPIARIRELHRWLAWLARDGVAFVAVPLQSDDGSTVVERRGQFWQLEPWLPGTADFHATATDEKLRSTVTALARLHLASDRYVPTTAGAQWFARGLGLPDALSERLARLQQVIATPVAVPNSIDQLTRGTVDEMHREVASLAPRIASEISSCMHIRVPLHPCLRDIWHDHVLFTGDVVTGIIDPSAARTECVASDLSRLLGSLLPTQLERWSTAVEAYASVRPLSDDERQLIPLLDRSGVVLSAAHWLERMRSQPLGEREWNRVRALAERLATLADGVVKGGIESRSV